MVGATAGGDGKKRRKATTARERRALEVGRAFAEIIRDEPIVRELWVTVERGDYSVGLWLVTDPIDLDTIGELYASPLNRLYQRFPEGDFDFNVLNPSHLRGDLHQRLPKDAERVPLRVE